MKRPLILGFDTSAAHCAAALVRGDQVLCQISEEMTRGQAERLMSLLQEVLEASRVAFSDLDALAVGTGPGNFTGIRIGVAAARGLALGLECPVYGVTGFEARARLAPQGTTIAIPAPREQVYIEVAGQVILEPVSSIKAPAPEPAKTDIAVAIARHAGSVWPQKTCAPAPFYARPPDAAPARDTAPAVLP